MNLGISRVFYIFQINLVNILKPWGLLQPCDWDLVLDLDCMNTILKTPRTSRHACKALE